jgi:tetratricopeptide (TPR) repeat protein
LVWGASSFYPEVTVSIRSSRRQQIVTLSALLCGSLLMMVARATIAASTATTQPLPSVIWLGVGQRPPQPVQTGLLSWELYRQAVLIAARDGLGLQTRDESLREWLAATPPPETLSLNLDDREFELRRTEGPRTETVWHAAVPPDGWSRDYVTLTEQCEQLSRADFVSALRAQGWGGRPNAIAPDAAMPDAESLLGQMDELSQFAVLRLAHAAIRATGESPARLGALVRAYANLSQLTRFQWSAANRVYAARALLYGQRMVATDPTSAFSLWHRAYARALAGLPRAALSDLAEASKAKPSVPAPAWVGLLGPYCKYQPGKLRDAAAADPSQSSLATFLAFGSIENSGCQAAVMDFAQAALKTNPQCLRVVDKMCDETGPGMLNDLSERGPQLFSELLGDRLEQMPQLPEPVAERVRALRRPTGNPLGRETVCQSLLAQGQPAQDLGEPSWGALARMIQEITFVHVQRRAALIAQQWGIDASDYVAEVRPLIAEHPYKNVIEILGLLHGGNLGPIQDALKDLPTEQLPLSAIHVINLESLARPKGSPGPDRTFTAIYRNLDGTAHDLEQFIAAYSQRPLPRSASAVWDGLAKVSPDSPALIAAEIRDHWDAAKAATWDNDDHTDYPSVAWALGQKYAELKNWEAAQRCFKRYIALSPDLRGYRGLADTYRQQNHEDLWLDTLSQFLQQTDYGLQHAAVQVEIARYYMASGEYAKALPYADAAAETGAGWATDCAAGAHAGVGDWDNAQRLIVEGVQHYSNSPFRWYVWCLRTGHGDRDAALQALHAYYTERADRLSDEDMNQWACLDVLEKKEDQSLAMFQKHADRDPSPASQLRVAIIADGLMDVEARDEALKKIAARPNMIAPLAHVAAALRDAIKKGADAKPDTAKLNIAIKNAKPEERITICYVAGRFVDQRGDKKAATDYFRRCIFGFTGYSIDLVLAEDALRQRGVDPLELERAAAGPAHQISLEP